MARKKKDSACYRFVNKGYKSFSLSNFFQLFFFHYKIKHTCEQNRCAFYHLTQTRQRVLHKMWIVNCHMCFMYLPMIVCL